MSIDILIAEYPGDGAWKRFVCKFPNQPQPDLGIGDPTIERVLIADLGSFAKAWFQSPIGALEGRTPEDVARNHPQGLLAVRSAIMRMPR